MEPSQFFYLKKNNFIHDFYREKLSLPFKAESKKY